MPLRPSRAIMSCSNASTRARPSSRARAASAATRRQACSIKVWQRWASRATIVSNKEPLLIHASTGRGFSNAPAVAGRRCSCSSCSWRCNAAMRRAAVVDSLHAWCKAVLLSVRAHSSATLCRCSSSASLRCASERTSWRARACRFATAAPAQALSATNRKPASRSLRATSSRHPARLEVQASCATSSGAARGRETIGETHCNKRDRTRADSFATSSRAAGRRENDGETVCNKWPGTRVAAACPWSS
mmetsp:Transcript_8174/g.20532  ORF Transcript_8174/g.20532 Transcript_8174/m.20532 type:complete len:247 (-) Transcript_8174:1558-2298(-)